MPNSVKFDMLMHFHEASGHLGRDKMLAALKDYYFCCGVVRVVDKVIHECAICQFFKDNARGGEPVCNRQTTGVLDQYAVDVLELEPANGNVKYMLVAVDVHSRFVHVIPMKNKQSKTIAAALEQCIFPSLYMVPKAIISNNGPEFQSEIFAQLLGWLVVSLFIYLFICWSSRMTALLLCCHSVAPCSSKGGISASAICQLWRFVFRSNI